MPLPGEGDQGKTPGQGKGESKAPKSGNPNGKGHAGDEGKPGEKSGIGDASASGQGKPEGTTSKKPAQKSARTKMVGPDGTIFEPRESPSEAEGTGKALSGQPKPEAQAPPDSPPRPDSQGGKGGTGGPSPQNAQPGESPAAPPPSDIGKLFGPEARSTAPSDRVGDPQGGTGPGAQGASGKGEAARREESMDLTQKAAAERLREVIRRIQKGREQRPQTPQQGAGSDTPSDRRRDW